MITDPSEYLYVTGDNIDGGHPHGDMDRVIFDGKVMPLRTGNTENLDAAGQPIPKKNIMRGEDICFLLEATRERIQVVRGRYPFQVPPSGPDIFSRKFNLDHLVSLGSRFSAFGAQKSNDYDWSFVPRDTDGPVTAAEVTLTGSESWSEELAKYAADFWPGLTSWPNGPGADSRWHDAQCLNPSSRLRRELLDCMFEDLKLLSAFRLTCDVPYSAFRVKRVYPPQPSYPDGRTDILYSSAIYADKVVNNYHPNGPDTPAVYSGYSSLLDSLDAGSAVSASDQQVGNVFFPIILVRGYVRMATENLDTHETTVDLEVTKNALVRGSMHQVRADGEMAGKMYCGQSDYEDAGRYMMDLLTQAGYDDEYADNVTAKTSKHLQMTISFIRLMFFVRLGDHTKWWQAQSDSQTQT